MKIYLYHPSLIARILTFIGLCKLLIANRIGKPEFVLSRLIVVLSKSFDQTERSNEDFNIKVYEIFSSFLYAYCLSDKNHIKSIIKSVVIVLTSHILCDSSTKFDRSVVNDYTETKFEFLNQLLVLIAKTCGQIVPMKNIIFKVFKYLYFVTQYILEDHSNLDGKENKHKKVNVTYSMNKKIKTELKKLFEKSGYDQFLINEMKDENYIKLFPFIQHFDEFGLKNISTVFQEHLESMKEKNFVYEVSGKTIELNDEERSEIFKEYVGNKQIKYFKLFEESYTFLTNLKEDKFGVIYEENSRIEDDDHISRKSMNVSRISENNNKKRNVMIEYEEDEEPKEVETKKNKRKSSPKTTKQKTQKKSK